MARAVEREADQQSQKLFAKESANTYWARCVEGDFWASLARDADRDFLMSDDS